jgi:hypothetical protein
MWSQSSKIIKLAAHNEKIFSKFGSRVKKSVHPCLKSVVGNIGNFSLSVMPAVSDNYWQKTKYHF